jgi:hypothetical protein
MFRGYEPFTAKTDEELVANKEARVEFTEADWVRHFDGSAIWSRKMMHPDPAQRLDAKAALRIPGCDVLTKIAT